MEAQESLGKFSEQENSTLEFYLTITQCLLKITIHTVLIRVPFLLLGGAGLYFSLMFR